MLVGDVVGELELVEGDDLLHPLLPRGRAVRVDVHALRHLRVGLARHHPPAATGNMTTSHHMNGWSGVEWGREGKRGIEIGMLANRHLFHLNEHHSALRFGVTSWELALPPPVRFPPLKFSSCMHIDDRTHSPIVEFVSVVV